MSVRADCSISSTALFWMSLTVFSTHPGTSKYYTDSFHPCVHVYVVYPYCVPRAVILLGLPSFLPTICGSQVVCLTSSFSYHSNREHIARGVMEVQAARDRHRPNDDGESATAADKLREAARRRREKLLHAQARRMRIASGEETGTATRRAEGEAPGLKEAAFCGGTTADGGPKAEQPGTETGIAERDHAIDDDMVHNMNQEGVASLPPRSQPAASAQKSTPFVTAALTSPWIAVSVSAADAALRAMHASTRMRAVFVACTAVLAALVVPERWNGGAPTSWGNPSALRMLVAAEAVGALAYHVPRAGAWAPAASWRRRKADR